MNEIINILITLVGNIIAFILPTMFFIIAIVLAVLKSKGKIFKNNKNNKSDNK